MTTESCPWRTCLTIPFPYQTCSKDYNGTCTRYTSLLQVFEALCIEWAPVWWLAIVSRRLGTSHGDITRNREDSMGGRCRTTSVDMLESSDLGNTTIANSTRLILRFMSKPHDFLTVQSSFSLHSVLPSLSFMGLQTGDAWYTYFFAKHTRVSSFFDVDIIITTLFSSYVDYSIQGSGLQTDARVLSRFKLFNIWSCWFMFGVLWCLWCGFGIVQPQSSPESDQ